MTKDDHNYLEQLWVPTVHDLVKYDQKRWIIESFEPGFPEQVLLRAMRHNNKSKRARAWIQDCEWMPTKPSLERIVQGFGCMKVKMGYKHDRWYFKTPTCLGDYASIIRSCRLMELNHGRDILKTYLSRAATGY